MARRDDDDLKLHLVPDVESGSEPSEDFTEQPSLPADALVDDEVELASEPADTVDPKDLGSGTYEIPGVGLVVNGELVTNKTERIATDDERGRNADDELSE